ncbi:hypothetical protein ABE137_12335 [Brevibacillus laterosporus]|uniref:hypothetical protein n=1 Tax=Brevibacillus phage Sundance TaxID=1691958 RepID=UPI0006BC3258|nr:hypothetical protein [Brevibacillus laterosporus]YP_009194190.1 hypothetical protein AVT09_gp140 [Brevibacillus phage Sundance]ALA47956.1 hypothetical protein SUNDANCE_140 [Brevibacillus phage Sundance]MCR8994574.1 hypothetical protein [Brevibacillus laterosporus]
MRYSVEEKEGAWSLIETTNEGKKKVVAVFFIKPIARIACRLLNEYANKGDNSNGL